MWSYTRQVHMSCQFAAKEELLFQAAKPKGPSRFTLSGIMKTLLGHGGLCTSLRLIFAFSFLFRATIQAPTRQSLHIRSADEDSSNDTVYNTPVSDDGVWITSGTFLAYANGTNVTLGDGTVIPVIDTPKQARRYIRGIPHNKAMLWSGVGLNQSRSIANDHNWTTVEMAVKSEISLHPWAEDVKSNPYYKWFWEVISQAFAESLVDEGHEEVHVALRPPSSIHGDPYSDGRVFGGSYFGYLEWPIMKKANITVKAIHPQGISGARAALDYEISPKDDVRLWQKSGKSKPEDQNVNCSNPQAKLVLFCRNQVSDEERKIIRGGNSTAEIFLPKGGYCQFSHNEILGQRRIHVTHSEDTEWNFRCLNHDHY